MNIIQTLNESLLKQPFAEGKNDNIALESCRQIAYMYSKIENSIAVLSDLKSNHSDIFYGRISNKLFQIEKPLHEHISSIWEDGIFNNIHPDDLINKHLLELKFTQLLKSLPIEKRSDYQITSIIRMKDNTGQYKHVHHRMFYVQNCPLGNLWLALCLYNLSHEKFVPEFPNGIIIDSFTGEVINSYNGQIDSILSKREVEILKLIERGNRSEDISQVLCISKNTVSRHRQNILSKLRVKNSFEACRIAKLMGII